MSGPTHTKYDHYYFPKLVELKCPTCQSKANAINISKRLEEEFFIDLAPYERIWEFNCSVCIKRTLLDWQEIKTFDLWYSLSIKNTRIWAWNKNHFELVYLVLKKKNYNNHKWKFFKNYVNKKWYTSIKSTSDFKKIAQMLKE